MFVEDELSDIHAGAPSLRYRKDNRERDARFRQTATGALIWACAS
jgi:hypothetical protein